jgi:hypothetical protein
MMKLYEWKKIFLLSAAIIFFSSCGSHRYILDSSFEKTPVPPLPDYSIENSWASLPQKNDPADSLPQRTFTNGQVTAEADVFFIHPTTYTYKPTTQYLWNGDVHDEQLNNKTDFSTILYQASVFNGSCKIYAPRYRQAHISAFYSSQKDAGSRALDTAYSDVKAAFQYYLDHYNKGRPIVIASHSQGTNHAYRLLKEFFQDGSLKNQLVAAYLIGMPINPDSLQFLLPCNAPDQTGCYCSWNTFAKGYYPRYYDAGLVNAICTNPLTWKCDSTYADPVLNKGGILRDYEMIYPEICDAQVHDGMLWISKPDFPGSRILNIKIYHVGDYNLFYLNIRENIQQRISAFLKK